MVTAVGRNLKYFTFEFSVIFEDFISCNAATKFNLYYKLKYKLNSIAALQNVKSSKITEHSNVKYYQYDVRTTKALTETCENGFCCRLCVDYAAV